MQNKSYHRLLFVSPILPYIGGFYNEKLRINEAAWLEKSGRWSIKVQRDGERKQFTSSKPGRKGKLEAERKADEWLEKGVVKDQRFAVAYDEFVAAKRRETGTSWTTQLETASRL